MNDRYIKLYSKIIKSEIFHDEKALKVFIWILCSVDYTTGKMRFGRYWAAEILQINPNSLYHVLTRLSKKYKILNIKTNNKFSEISVINWAKYQIDEPKRTGKRTTKEQQKNTNQEVIESNNTNVLLPKKSELTIFLEEFNKDFGTRYRVTKYREEQFNKRRKTFSLEEILKAGKGLSSDPFNHGYNDRKWKAGPDYLLRSDEQVDRFLNVTTQLTKEGYTESGYKVIS